MKKIFALATILSLQFMNAQSNRNVGEFSALKAYDQITVKLYASGENKVETTSNGVEIVNKNGELKIRMMPAMILQGKETTVKVFYKNLCDIQASQGSTILADADLECKSLSLTSNEGSNIKLTVEADRLNIKTNSGGIIEVSGNAAQQNVTVNSAGKYLGKNLDSENSVVVSNAGGIAEINVTDSVDATTRAGGVIDIYGNPSDRKFKNVIGGKINFK